VNERGLRKPPKCMRYAVSWSLSRIRGIGGIVVFVLVRRFAVGIGAWVSSVGAAWFYFPDATHNRMLYLVLILVWVSSG